MMTNAELQDLHLLYCNKGRKEKVVLGLTDTMYKKRIQTAGRVDRMSQEGFKELVQNLPGIWDCNPFIVQRINVDFIFMSNVGPNKDKKFELTFDHFLDALMSLAKLRYPNTSPNEAYHNLLLHQVRPLYKSIFGENEPTVSHASALLNNDYNHDHIPDNESINRRNARLVLTPEGTMPLSAISHNHGPAVQMAISELPSNDYSTRFDVKLTTNDRTHSNTVSGASSVDGHSNPSRNNNKSNHNAIERIIAREMVASLALQEEHRQYNHHQPHPSPSSKHTSIPTAIPSSIINEAASPSSSSSASNAATASQLETLTNQLSSLIVVLESLRNENIQLKQRINELENK